MKQCCMRLDESAPVDEGNNDRNNCNCAGLDRLRKRLSFVPAMLCMLSLMVPATLMSSDYAYGWIS